MAARTRFRNVIAYRNMGENARGTLVYQVVHLTKVAAEEMGLQPKQRCRVTGTLDGHEISLGLSPDPETGKQYLIVSKKLLKAIKKDVGDEVEVVLELRDPDEVDIPLELDRALSGKALRVWNGLTAGKQRTWTTFVDKAKMQATRTKRVKEVIARLKRIYSGSFLRS